jgi:hypothetical protein
MRTIRGHCLGTVLLLTLYLGSWMPPPAAMAQEPEPIRVLFTEVENDFPDGLTFRIGVEADYPLINVILYFYIQGDTSVTSQPIDFESGTEVTAVYTWDTSRITVAPSSPVLYYWELRDEAGNQLTTPEQRVAYDDLRFPWQELSDPELIVRWYQGDEEFGRFVYETAELSLSRMKEQSGLELEFPIYVLLYANDEDFASWHFFVDDWVAGQAFTRLGVTTQIIPPGSNRAWIQRVIPHEIAHLFLYQVLHDGMASWPSWFDEGLAQYYELGSPDAALERAAQAAREGTLLPLVSLSGGFGRDPEQVRLSYDQSLSVVTYLLESWGKEGLQGLIAAFRQGKSARAAVEESLGVTWEEFEAGWITWMGVPVTPAPPPTPTSTLVWPTAPAGWPTPTRLPTKTSTATPTATPTVTPQPSTATPTATKTPTQTPVTPAGTTPAVTRDLSTPTPGSEPSRSLCGGAALGSLLLPGLALLFVERVRGRPRPRTRGRST